jgi:predicted DNA-binding transcriptional regulator AlpA
MIMKTDTPTSHASDVSGETPVSALLNDKQVMELLGISRVKLHTMMRKDGLPYIKLGEGRGASLRFSRHSLDEWLAQQEHRAGA